MISGNVKIIRTKRTGVYKKTISRHLIYGTYTPGSLAGYVQLKSYYKELELKELMENVSPPRPKSKLLNKKTKGKLSNTKIKRRDWYIRLQYTTRFLKNKEEECGSLTCVYCGQENLVIYPHDAKNKKKSNMATADHFIPNAERLLDYYDGWNLTVCCWTCNDKKKAKIYSLDRIEFYKKGEYKEIFKKAPKLLEFLKVKRKIW